MARVASPALIWLVASFAQHSRFEAQDKPFGSAQGKQEWLCH